MKKTYLAIFVIFLVLSIDQIVKIWVKLNMRIGESFHFFGGDHSWFQIYFTENPGMAFGLEFGGDFGKLALSLFRIIAVGFIAYYLHTLIKQNKPSGFIICISMICAGAAGNIFDSIFYGLIFSESSFHQVATTTSFGQGYTSFLHGKVVDMLYFPLIEGNYPNWVPYYGGKHFLFFQPIFNIADASISLGVSLVILFYRNVFKEEPQAPVKETDEIETPSSQEEIS